MIDRQQVNLRLERELVDQLDDLAKTEHVDRTEIARRILVSGVAEARVDRALRDYAAGRVTSWRAASDAGISLYDMLDRIHERGVPYEMDLEVLDRVGRRALANRKVGIAERPAAYNSDKDADAGIQELREKYKPARVQILFVSESSPAQGTHFYRANSNLFRATRAAFAAAFGEDSIPTDQAFLRFFADQGAWLVDLADQPVNQMPSPKRRTFVEAGIPRLAEVIKSERPGSVVVIKRDIADAVRRALETAGSEAAALVLPFPVRQWARVYETELAAFLRN